MKDENFDKHYLYNFIQKMFLTVDSFDDAIIYMIRCMIKNFLAYYQDRKFNGLPFKESIACDASSLSNYI